MIWLYAPHTIDVTALQGTYLNQQATSVALFGSAGSGNLAVAPTNQTVAVFGS